jgi:hypothetical protein
MQEMKIRTPSERASIAVQRELFSMGYEWLPWPGRPAGAQYTEDKFLFTDQDGTITRSSDTTTFNDNWRPEYKLTEVGFMPVESGGKPEVTEEATANPKEKYGLAKMPLSLWPALATAYGSLGLLNGRLKYGGGNFKATPVIASIYIDALERHLSAWKNGEEFDPVDGSPHLGGILANVAIILEARAVGSLVDDRQIAGGYLKELEALTTIANNLHKFHEGKTPRHYTLADNHIQEKFNGGK